MLRSTLIVEVLEGKSVDGKELRSGRGCVPQGSAAAVGHGPEGSGLRFTPFLTAANHCDQRK